MLPRSLCFFVRQRLPTTKYRPALMRPAWGLPDERWDQRTGAGPDAIEPQSKAQLDPKGVRGIQNSFRRVTGSTRLREFTGKTARAVCAKNVDPDWLGWLVRLREVSPEQGDNQTRTRSEPAA